jgi:hypothetical protein
LLLLVVDDFDAMYSFLFRIDMASLHKVNVKVNYPMHAALLSQRSWSRDVITAEPKVVALPVI